MKQFTIPFSVSKIDGLAGKSKSFSRLFRRKKNSKMDFYLKSAEVHLTREEYLGICSRSIVRNFILFLFITSIVLSFMQVKMFYLYSTLLSFVLSFFVFITQANYPKNYSSRKSRDIEKNLIPAMQDMFVQLQSGIPLFRIMVNLSLSNYGEVSFEFGKVVREINAGKSQIAAIDSLIEKNESLYFRRVLWQISNGMKAGSDMTEVIKEGIDNLNKEQSLQIQSYGSKLNPLIMFYMLIGIILPALAITFLIILSSLMDFSEEVVKIVFYGLLVMVALIQVMFLGIVKTRRPSLL